MLRDPLRACPGWGRPKSARPARGNDEREPRTFAERDSWSIQSVSYRIPLEWQGQSITFEREEVARVRVSFVACQSFLCSCVMVSKSSEASEVPPYDSWSPARGSKVSVVQPLLSALRNARRSNVLRPTNGARLGRTVRGWGEEVEEAALTSEKAVLEEAAERVEVTEARRMETCGAGTGAAPELDGAALGGDSWLVLWSRASTSRCSAV